MAMNVPLSWLRAYVDVDMPVEQLAHRLTMAGIEVGGVERIGGWNECYVGHVLDVGPHPNADRLRLCTVDIGGERLQVVCGAPNVAEQQKIAFAKVGATLFNTHSGKVEPLKAAKIRGVTSEGMICSVLELGIGEEHDGILVLPDDAPTGTPLAEYLGDTVLELEVTANRPDCFSVLGVAREVAAFSGTQVAEPDAGYPGDGAPVESLASVEIEDPALCARYTAALLTGVSIGPSPDWLQERLTRAGQRPINNIVDVTNYVMLETGQPLHAFDFDKVAERRIIVRQARPGEKHVTLDGVERELAPPMVVIADPEKAVGLGGVMGGANTEVTEETNTILLESASFHPFNTRRTADELKLRTEASLRFEKGWRQGLPPVGLRRAVKLMLEVAGGVAARGIIDVYPDRPEPRVITLTAARMEKVLGVTVPMADAARTLTSLGIACRMMGDDALEVEAPPWRADITIEDDLVEEVVRVIGYDDVPTAPLAAPIPLSTPDTAQAVKEEVRDLLASIGMQEVITYSMVSEHALELAYRGAEPPAPPMRAFNPISSEHECLRTSLRPGLPRTLAANQRHEGVPQWYFEVGKEFIFTGDGLPDERQKAAGVLSGPGAQASWAAAEATAGFYDAKGVVEALCDRVGVTPSFEPLDDPFYHPGRAATIAAGGQRIGELGEVHPEALDAFDVRGEGAVYFEVDMAALTEAVPQSARRFRSISVYPEALRDLALVVGMDVPADRVRAIIEQHPLVARATLFDVYAGEQVGADVRSLAYRVSFQAADRTLTAEEVQRAMDRLLSRLERELGAAQRQG
ncbi:MAG: phenylalanine--tRNA ligase subunit beta [Chloroflexota bacterium]|nr:phenylalanine--tRNA ligase subunit beta [Chloroflexota bacterium]